MQRPYGQPDACDEQPGRCEVNVWTPPGGPNGDSFANSACGPHAAFKLTPLLGIEVHALLLGECCPACSMKVSSPLNRPG